jgi:transposase-like protein
MDKKSKVILGLKRGCDYSDSERHQIIQEYITSGKTKKEIWFKYTGKDEEHGNLRKWMGQLGYNSELRTRRYILAENNEDMPEKKVKISVDESFETLQLKKRIEELEKQLKDAEMKAIAFSTMIDIAERNLNVSIRKKVSTKPLKK